ncbi:ABC transporter substrate-binding protein [Alteribacillus iranensis]|uniref:Spermidine/putrescine transport system substrate-binding protein n=1 Tax=Alteribacillus iranensis TaxID=930128 RepID=A0A1I2E272_9BACI|nr:spermidine/putrescine ABC transporter substrate-binding protein [Alteribacillus iranensis]SFE86776.1 spermidine/putrescine transport system substrate-binding protein [Alteribacillus iranensis]
MAAPYKSLLFLCIVTLLLTACGDKSESSSAEDSNQELAEELYFFNWGENIDPEILEDFEEEFGVKVIYDTYTSNQELITKLNSDTVDYDVVVPTDYFVEQMAEEGLLQELNMDNLPNFKNISEEFRNPSFDPDNTYSVPYLYGSIGIAYNTEYVDEPRSWEALWDPAYEGRVTIQETPREGVSMALQMLGYDMNDPSDEELMEAKQKISEVNENILAFDNTPADKLVSEEVWLAQTYSDQAGTAIAENDKISYLLPEDGGMLWMDNFVVPVSSKNKYTAEVFINYMLRPEVSKKLTDAIPSSNPNKAAQELMSEEESNNPASYPEIPESSSFFEYMNQEQLGKMNQIYKEIKVE